MFSDTNVFRCSQFFQMISGCPQLLTDALETDVFKLCSDVPRGFQMFTDFLRCSQMFSRCSQDVLSIFFLMFLGCFQDVLVKYCL